MKLARFERLAPFLVLAVFATALLTACGGPVRRINPPGASIQKLVVREDGSLTLHLRLQNFSDVSTRFGSFDGGLYIAGTDAGPLKVAIDLDVPAHAAEVFETKFVPEAAAREALAAAFEARKRSGAGVAYRLVGTAVITEPSDSFEIEYESELSPVPGIPGEYR